MFSLGPWSARIQTEFHVLRPTWVSSTGRAHPVAYRAFTFCGPLSQHGSARVRLCNCPSPLRKAPGRSRNPTHATPASLTRAWFRLIPFRSPLLGDSLRFPLLRLLRCFTSPGARPHSRATGLLPSGCPIRKSSDQWMLAPPRGLSQLATSFIGVWRQGIPRVPFVP